MADEPRVLPPQQVSEIEMFVDDQLDRAAKYDNAEVLDEGGVFTLHRLAARIYAAGFEDGERAQSERDRGARRRARKEAS